MKRDQQNGTELFRDKLFDLLNDSEGMGIADLNADEQNRLFTVRKEIAAADSFTGELAGTGRVFRRG